MRTFGKFVVLFVLVTLVISVVPSFAQGPYPIVTEVAVKQSADLGDPYSYTALIVQEKTIAAEHVAVIVADPGQLVNVEHPEGANGLISGQLIVFDPDADMDQVMAELMPMISSLTAEWIYVGADTARFGGTAWQISSTYWTIDPRENTVGEPVDVPNAVWADPVVLPLQVQNLTCPNTASGCLFQSWDGINGARAWHVVVPAGLNYTSPFAVEGTWYQVSNVALADVPTLTARFAQMVEEVIVRDDPDPADDTKNMTVFKLWVGPTAPTDWTQIAMFDYSASIVDTGIGVTVKVATANVRDNPNSDTANIVTSLSSGTEMIAVSRSNTPDESGNFWLTVYWGEPRQYGFIRADLVSVQEGVEIEDLPPIGQAGPGL